VKALLARRPALGGVFAFGLVALLGLPPFSLFISELNMLRAEVHVGLGWVAAISLVLMAVIFGSVMSHGRHMLFGARPDGEPVHKSPLIVSVPLIGALVGCGAIGVLAWPLDTSCARPRWWS
jgi:hydrogenase-4 component F